MAKIHGFKSILCLFISIFLNCFFVALFFRREPELTWTKKAAAEAEAIAAISCSGHGRAFVDLLSSEGKPVCDCNTCYGGSDCSQFTPSCPADADSGDPLFLEPFWMQQAMDSAVVVSGWHRMSYRFDNNSEITMQLEKHIRLLHSAVGNAVTSGRFILCGAGSTQLINAAVHALSTDGSSTPARVVASVPFYPVYKTQTVFFNSEDYKWQGDASLLNNNNTFNSSTTFIEFVASPNNPDGMLKQPVLRGPSVKTIYDHAYFWPHFTAIPAPADEDLMIFTISKVSGHAGSRFGWALIKDEGVYERMLNYLTLNSKGVSRDTQIRALKLLKVAIQNGGRELFGFAYTTMRERWQKLSTSLSTSKRFSLQKLSPQYCTFFRNVTGPSPAYAWLKCEMEEDQDCTAVLRAAGIIGRTGTIFGAEGRYVRLSLIKTQDDFDLLLGQINALVFQESVKFTSIM